MRHAVAVTLFLVAATLSAATFDVPTDAELLGRADLVVVATVEGFSPREAADRMVYTDYRLIVEETLKGSATGMIVVSEAGGFINGHGVLIPGSATYEAGTRVLTFLRKNEDGTYRTAFMSLGNYRFTHEGGVQVLVRDSDVETIDGTDPGDARSAQAYLDAIRDGVPERAPRLATNARPEFKPVGHAAANTYVLRGQPPAQNFPIRWEDCEKSSPLCPKIQYTTNGPQNGTADTPLAIQRAMAAWTDHAESFVRLELSGFNEDITNDNDDINDIVFNGGTNHLSCDGSLGCGLVYFGPTHTYEGETWYSVVSGDVVIYMLNFNSQPSLDAVLAHELGHTLALKHGPSGSLMASVVPQAGGADLKQWDEEAMAEVYGNGLPCSDVNITGTSGGGNVPYGEKKTLSVTGTGTPPFTYQWYQGTSGDTATPVGTSSQFQTPNITSPRSYWVRVSNSCPSSDDSATITVTPLPCTEPDINTQPESKRINPGATATLTVQADGTSPLKYQWYQGTVGNTSNPVGSNSNTFTTPALNATTSYWVKVGNNCGSENSTLATITVSSTCVAPAVTNQPTNVTIGLNETTTLSVSVSGDSPFTYQWYNGASPNPASPIGGANGPSYVAGPFASAGTHTYWLKINNACGETATTTITVTVDAGCQPVLIVSQPSTVSVSVGEGATIGVGVTGTEPYTFQWYAGDAGDPSNPIAGATNASYAAGPFNTPGTYKYWVKATNACNPLGNGSGTISILVACPTLLVPEISAPPVAPHSSPYDISWTGDPAISTFELQEATNASFTANLVTYPAVGLQQTIPAHSAVSIDTRFYYRVRALSVCTGQPTAYSMTVSTVVTPPLPQNSLQFSISIPEGTDQLLTQDYLVPGFGETATAGDTFSIAIDVPWMTVFPAGGALSAGGTTVQFTIDPNALEVGSTTATITVTRTQGSGKVGTNNGSTTTYVPFGVSLVTPVTPSTRDGEGPPGTLIIPAVAHAQGIGSPFQSDVRIANVGFNDITYEISFTPSGSGGWASNKMTTVTVRGGDTLAFNDIVKAWYGSGLLGETGSGTIEIRPLEAADPLSTFASSRTYALVGNGTLGQFIPALAQNQFISNTPNDSLARISLQQIANSAAYRTNVGFVNGTTSTVEVLAKLIDGNNNILQTTQFALGAFEHLQNSLGGLFNNTSIDDGRVEVEALSPNGKVTAYASVVNNATSDPFLVFPEQPARQTSERYVLPGIAEFVAGSRNFHSDMRVYNGGAAPVSITLEYYERGQSTPRADAPVIQRTLNAGQVLTVNDVLPSLFGLSAGGGSVVAKAPAGSSLVLTAQTYSREEDGGTKGQFIPGVTSHDAVGFGDRAVEVLQLEQSAQYRSNLGLVEVTGNDIVVEVVAYEADTKISAATSVNLKANEYRQLDRILESMGLGTVYNGRISLKVLSGNGRVAGYASTINNITEDPTYVPSQ